MTTQPASSVPPLTACLVCSNPVDSGSLTLDRPLLITSCLHTFHHACQAPLFDISLKPCPLCRTTCVQTRAGSDFATQVWKIFLIALQYEQDTVLETLDSANFTNGTCPTCQEPHPLLPLFFDPTNKRLIHDTCSPPNTALRLTVDIVVDIAKKCASQNDQVKAALTPPPPSLREQLYCYYPEVAPYAEKAVAVFASITFIVLACSPLYTTKT